MNYAFWAMKLALTLVAVKTKYETGSEMIQEGKVETGRSRLRTDYLY